MAEFQTVMRERRRMCKQIGDCGKCQINFRNNKSESSCDTFMMESPAEAERIIMQWASEHPIKTNGMRFSEVFGFNLDALYSVSEAAIKWLDEEYKGGDGNG